MKVEKLLKSTNANDIINIFDSTGYLSFYKGETKDCPKELKKVEVISGRQTIFGEIDIRINKLKV